MIIELNYFETIQSFESSDTQKGFLFCDNTMFRTYTSWAAYEAVVKLDLIILPYPS